MHLPILLWILLCFEIKDQKVFSWLSERYESNILIVTRLMALYLLSIFVGHEWLTVIALI